MTNGKTNFIWNFVDEDLASGRYDSVVTRYPPEPNGYLHIGHCKAWYLDFFTARRYGGKVNLRYDDTNPAKEKTEFVEGIQNDMRWMGFEWDELHFASEYYEEDYNYAVKLIEQGDAYIDELTQEQMREYRGTLEKPGLNSPWRERAKEESLRIFREMREGKHPEGSYTLRAKIDMSSPNVVMRDPILYRILFKEHHRTGSEWCIYPMYDYSHPLNDAMEGITHSICSLEFEIHRPLYDWVVQKCGFIIKPPRQIEFAKLNITRTIMSKRYLRRLVEEGYVYGWDDPRMPTLAAMRRRGYTPAGIIDFVERAGISKADSVVDFELLEACVRKSLEDTAPRAMVVLNPLKITFSNWEDGITEPITLENHPSHPEWGTREIKFGKTIYIEQEDFMEDPPKKFFRLKPGGEVRLKGAYIIKCEEVVKDADGNVTELICSVDLTSKSGEPGSERKVKGTLHWISEADAKQIEIRLYEPLLNDEPQEAESESEEDEKPLKVDFIDRLNTDSIKIIKGALAEPVVANAEVGAKFQFMRQGYFAKDPDGTADNPVYNRTVSLKDSWKGGN
ncbi:MAG: glutamine--tRNA ligase/YqeY domain fusion protein [Oscillospiraceae bacterium]|nr:glutamine--tRNA ligase/YqeY domain fusion protein [Oscillospiraceae bacterium]